MYAPSIKLSSRTSDWLFNRYWPLTWPSGMMLDVCVLSMWADKSSSYKPLQFLMHFLIEYLCTIVYKLSKQYNSIDLYKCAIKIDYVTCILNVPIFVWLILTAFVYKLAGFAWEGAWPSCRTTGEGLQAAQDRGPPGR